MKTTLGGDRLGSGNKQEISMRNYERSTHDLGYIWRSSMASGTLVPFMKELALPGDTFDIDLNAFCMTLPTIGPLFGSYKIQLDVFQAPIRLYQGLLHMNMLNIGMDMTQVKLPQMEVRAHYDPARDPLQQINPSSILSYLGISGVGRSENNGAKNVTREFNAVPYLAYWEIYKNYYANKQEEIGVAIHGAEEATTTATMSAATIQKADGTPENCLGMNSSEFASGTAIYTLRITLNGIYVGGEIDYSTIDLLVDAAPTTLDVWADNIQFDGTVITATNTQGGTPIFNVPVDTVNVSREGLRLQPFDLSLIDDMRKAILQDTGNSSAFIIDNTSSAPYSWPFQAVSGLPGVNFTAQYSQEGLAIKTYQSDLFNNWISTEWIDGTNGVNEISAVSTAGDSFTIDALNLANKVYNMLNRIAISGGSYDDWLDAVYTHERAKSTESPIYHGSLIKELSFEEVINTSASDGEPLGTLAGRGQMTDKHKGGSMKINISEPSYIIGIVSITPRVDYSQGNHWDGNLKTMDDLHKPALDEIGYQDLITDQMAWWETTVNDDGTLVLLSAGKQPAWINYMTNVNRCHGNFADIDKEMFMTLNRRYEYSPQGITDLTTYIDPTKFNQIFADTNLDAQNFWMQIKVDNIARRKMSAKVIPNL